MADPEIDGLRIREIMKLLNGFRGLNLMGADVVCFSPPLASASQITATTVSVLLLQFVSLIADKISTKA